MLRLLGAALTACSSATPLTAGAETPWLDPTFGTMVGATPEEPQVFVSFPGPFLTLDLAMPPTGSRTAGFRSISLPLLSGSVRTPGPLLGESDTLLEALATARPLSSRKSVSSRAIDAISRSSSSSTPDRWLRIAGLSGFCRLGTTQRSPPPLSPAVRSTERIPCPPSP